VTNLTHKVETIHADSLGQQLPRSGNGDELDRLAEVFNSMMKRLDHSFTHIREFTLNASHELKTPLTIMRGEIETRLGDSSGDTYRPRILRQPARRNRPPDQDRGCALIARPG